MNTYTPRPAAAQTSSTLANLDNPVEGWPAQNYSSRHQVALNSPEAENARKALKQGDALAATSSCREADLERALAELDAARKKLAGRPAPKNPDDWDRQDWADDRVVTDLCTAAIGTESRLRGALRALRANPSLVLCIACGSDLHTVARCGAIPPSREPEYSRARQLDQQRLDAIAHRQERRLARPELFAGADPDRWDYHCETA